MKNLEKMGGELFEGMFYNSHIIGGINFVCIDESYHQAEYEQLDFLEKEVKKVSCYPFHACSFVLRRAL